MVALSCPPVTSMSWSCQYKTKGVLELSRAGSVPVVHLVLAASWLPPVKGFREKTLSHLMKFRDAVRMEAFGSSR